MRGIRQAAFDRANRLTSFMVVKANALGAKLGVNDVNLVTFADRFIRALGLASAAVDAVCRDVRGHVASRVSFERVISRCLGVPCQTCSVKEASQTAGQSAGQIGAPNSLF